MKTQIDQVQVHLNILIKARIDKEDHYRLPINALEPHQAYQLLPILSQNIKDIFTPWNELNPHQRYLFIFHSDGTDEQYNLHYIHSTPQRLLNYFLEENEEGDYDIEAFHENPTAALGYSVLPLIKEPKAEHIKLIEEIILDQNHNTIPHFIQDFFELDINLI